MRTPYKNAKAIADEVLRQLAPHCDRIEIAGSIRRKKETIGDVEIVAIPKPYDVGLFASGIATVVDQWPAIKGELPCKYTQRILPCGMKLDLFFATPDNWGLILAIRTGSAEFSRDVLARGWVANGYRSDKGMLHSGGVAIPTPEEEDLFRRCGVEWVYPEAREMDLVKASAGPLQTVTCLTVLEPYSWLIFNAGKDIENRTWSTTFRGRLYIHSGKRLYADESWIAEYYGPDCLKGCLKQRGHIVGHVDVVDCVDRSDSKWFSGPWEFVLANATTIKPIPYRGAQGFWKAEIPVCNTTS